MGCLCCGDAPVIGALCRSCALAIEPCEGLIPEHLHSRVDSPLAEAWVIDGFGGAHAVGATARIGRNHGCELVVLASSVSREHAALARTASGWQIRDLGSRNGTFVGGARCDAATMLPGRALIKVGDVALWFLSDVVQEPPDQHRATLTTDGKPRRVRYQLAREDTELSITVDDDLAAGGTLLWRRCGEPAWSERSLAPLEFQLLRALCRRAHEDPAGPATIRGCVPSKQLVGDLPFQSKYANQENVRQLVLRVRGVLADIGVAGILAVAPGRGYYLACEIASQPEL